MRIIIDTTKYGGGGGIYTLGIPIIKTMVNGYE